MMKKYIVLALVMVASAAFNHIDANNKKKKEAVINNTEVKKPVVLGNSSDSLSYAAGAAMTDGLLPFLKQQGVDAELLPDFIKGFNEAVSAYENKQEAARRKGFYIADWLVERMLPGLKDQFSDVADSIVAHLLFRGFADAIENDTTVMQLSQATSLFKQKETAAQQAKTEKQIAPGKAFLAENAKNPDVIVTRSGLQYKVLRQGDGPVPQSTDRVKVHYEGRLIDGTVFDASSKHGNEPVTFEANRVIKGWTEALCLMPVGSKWQLYIPQELAYGAQKAGQIPPYSTLIFDVELVGIEK